MTAQSKDFKRLLLASPTSSEAYAAIGHTLHQRVDYEAAIRCYRTGLRLDADCDRLHCLLGLTYHNLGNHPLAIHHYAKAAGLNPSNAEAHYYLGFILIQEGKANEAIEHLQQSLALQSDLNPAYYYLGITLERLGRHKEAQSILIQRLQDTAREPTPEVVFTLGELLSGRRRYQTKKCHTQALVDSLLHTLQKQQLHVFGDSHRSVFNNLEKVRCYNVGAGTAYNLIRSTSSTGAGNKILAITQELEPNSDCLVLVFGEIDCMEHLLKNHFRTGEHAESLIETLVSRYISFASRLTQAGFSVLVYGPAFSGIALNSYGSIEQRNWTLKRFNQALRAACQKNKKILFASLDKLIVSADMQPMLELSEDARHLDDFPQGSKVLQALVFAKFLEAAHDKQCCNFEIASFDASTTNLALQKPYILMRSQDSHNSSPIVSTGITDPTHHYRLSVQRETSSTLIVDFLDHVRLDKLHFKLSTERRDKNISGELQVFGIDQHQLSLIGNITLAEMQSANCCVTLKGSVVRGLMLRVQATRDDDPGATTNLILQELCVESSPCHERLM